MLIAADRQRVTEVLTEAQRRGALGRGAVGEHVRHAEAMARAIDDAPGSCCDLGSGAGVPALVFALLWPATAWTLVDAQAKRARWLEAAVLELDLADRCRVVPERAEALGRDPAYRDQFGVVTARAFGAPAVTAECGAPLLEVGGRLVVSEPPEPDPSRWPEEALRGLGLGPARRVEDRSVPATVVVVEKVAPTPEAYPRRIGVPGKRPLWRAA